MTDRKRRYYSQVTELLRTADVAIELADARFIDSTRIPKLERRFGKKIFLVASKADLVPKSMRRPGVIYFSARTREGTKEILAQARDVALHNPFRRGKEGKIIVFGLPNVGKSSLINALRGRHSAKTGFRAGLTRGPQWIRLAEDLVLCDTPGVVDFEEDEQTLALKGALDVTEMKRPEQLAAELIRASTIKKPNPLFKYYGLTAVEDSEDALIQIAKKRGLLGKGGEPLVSEAAKMVVRDHQKGRFILL